MKSFDLDSRFHHRPSRSFHPSIQKSTLFRNPSVEESTSEQKVLEFKGFDYVIKDHGRTESLNHKVSFIAENGKNYFNSYSEKDHLSKALKKQSIGLHTSSLSNILCKNLSKDYLECIYLTSVYTINNYFGACSAKSEDPERILQYVNNLLQIPSKTKLEYFKKSKKIKAPDYILIMKIIEAVDLISTDVDGLSDPYCKIWMNNEKDSVKKTSVKERTLNPKWNENFYFNLGDLKNDVIHIEIWDEDPQGFTANIRQLKRIKGSRGLYLFCHDCCQSICCCGVKEDDFVGKVDVPVKDIRSEGIKDWMSLKDKEEKSSKGQLHISAEFSVLRPNQIQEALKRHLLLIKICLKETVKKNMNLQSTTVNWEQYLSSSALTLIFQHMVQSCLTPYEDALCKFVVFVYLTKSNLPINYHFLYTITDEAHESAKQLRSTDYGIENSLEDLYIEAVNNVYNICKSVVSTIHSINFVEDEIKCVEFEFVLKCAAVCRDITGKEDFLWSLFRSEAETWFNHLIDEIKNIDSEVTTEFFISTLTFILSYHSTLDKIVTNVFPNKTYTGFTYEVLDTALSKYLKPHIAKLSEESLNSLGKAKYLKLREALNIFMKIKELSEYISKTTNMQETEFQLGNYRDWFSFSIVEDWYKWKEEIIVPQIIQIINDDNLDNKYIECAERLEKQSSSAELTANLIEKELIQLRMFVIQPKCDFTFLEVLHSVCMKYSEFLLELIYSRNILSNFQLAGMKKLCAIANDLWSLAIFVQKTISDTVTNQPTNSYDTKFCLKLICYLLCYDICKEFERDVVAHIKNIVDANSKREQTQALKTYVRRMQHLFCEEAMPHMAFEIYLLFVRELWKTVISAVSFFKKAYKDPEVVSVFGRCRRFFVSAPDISSGLLAVLTETEKFCFIDELGKLKPFMWTEDFKMLKKELHQSVVIN